MHDDVVAVTASMHSQERFVGPYRIEEKVTATADGIVYEYSYADRPLVDDDAPYDEPLRDSELAMMLLEVGLPADGLLQEI